MRIVMVTKPFGEGADDEGAVANALTVLGHSVEWVDERAGFPGLRTPQGDLLLFFKWFHPAALADFAGVMPRCFWWFDRVSEPGDPLLEPRNRHRQAWMERVVPHIELGFCTDGDHVAADTTGKLHWLTQGADERVVGRGNPPKTGGGYILFTGIGKGGGRQRESFVAEMRERYGARFLHIERGMYGRELADLIAGASVVVAPDSPVSGRYWSNRAFVSLGFGAFLLHPYCEGLRQMYAQHELLMYRTRGDLHELIGHYLGPLASARRPVSEAGLKRTLNHHTYTHRVAELLRVCKERGLT